MRFPSIIVTSLLFLAVTFVQADREAKHGSAPTAWSNQIEKDLVQLIAKNEQARTIYTRVVRRLRRSGVPAGYVWQVFSNPRVRVEPQIARKFSRPAEKMDYHDYRKIFVNDDRINHGVAFYKQHKNLLNQVARKYGVDPYLILSFVGVETRYGLYDSVYPVFNSLHTIIHDIPGRAQWAEDEMVACETPLHSRNRSAWSTPVW